MTAPGLDLDEGRAVADAFGVSMEQVRRDHLISHVLAAVSRDHADEVVFFGGTALARTHLIDGRLSEDIDLIAMASRAETATRIERTLGTALRRSHGRIRWAPALSAVRDAVPGVLLADDGRLTLRVQLLNAPGYDPWPIQVRPIVQRYRDAPPATLRVPTLAAFVAWKTVAWFDRRAPRDLLDLWALAERGAITPRAAELFSAHGPPQPCLGADRKPVARAAGEPDETDRLGGRGPVCRCGGLGPSSGATWRRWGLVGTAARHRPEASSGVPSGSPGGAAITPSVHFLRENTDSEGIPGCRVARKSARSSHDVPHWQIMASNGQYEKHCYAVIYEKTISHDGRSGRPGSWWTCDRFGEGRGMASCRARAPENARRRRAVSPVLKSERPAAP